MALGGIRAAQKRRKRRLARRRRMMEMMAGEMPMEPMPFRPDRHGRFRGHRHHNHAGTQFHVRMKTDQVIGLLEDILAGLKSGTVAIEIDDDQITLKPAGKMDVRFRTNSGFRNRRSAPEMAASIRRKIRSEPEDQFVGTVFRGIVVQPGTKPGRNAGLFFRSTIASTAFRRSNRVHLLPTQYRGRSVCCCRSAPTHRSITFPG